MKIPKKTQLNQRTIQNQLSHVTCGYIKMCTLIRHIICESLMKRKHFRPVCSSIMYENTQKTQSNQRTFNNMQLHLVHRYIKMYISIRHTFCECLVNICVIKHKCRSLLWYYFQTYRTIFSTCPIKESQKAGYVRIN